MQFDPENPIIKLCGQGMLLEGEAKSEEAANLFMQAWEQAANDFERFIAAHYIARHQPDVAGKLKWDETALHLALNLKDEAIKGAYPSLYLNIAKCHEDMGNMGKAKENYESALIFAGFLSDDGYGNMIKAGINNGLARVK
jgi:rifampin ADP-ribosylating transferase